MDHIPIVVIGRIVAFANNNSLVLFSCCSRWLWYCVSRQNNLWHQRYKQYYNLADDSEIKWLAWYVKTVRVSKLVTSQTKKTVSTTQLDEQNIEWFRAFCYRRATDENWLKGIPYSIKDVAIEEPNNSCFIVLQRIAHHHADLRKCFIVEQCQPIGEAFTERFWRLRKLFQNDANYKYYAKQCLISDRFVVAITKQANNADFITEPCIIYIWPLHLISLIRPRQFSCLCDSASIRGRWMMINHLKPTTGETDRSNVLATHVFDLANGQLCMGTITTHHGETFLLKATEEAVTIFSRSLHYSDTTTTLKWNVWEFSARHLGYGPRCLMQGEICFKRFEDFKILVRKLDDNRVLIENNSKLAVNIVNKDRADEISLAMISTECGSPNACIKNVEPIWLLNNYRYSTVPLFGFNRILVMYSKNWAIHSLTDGAILAHIDVETLSSVPGAPRLLNINKYTKHFSLCIGGFIVCSSKDDGTLTAIDLINSNRTRKLGKKNSEYLYKQVLRRRTIIVRLDRLINHPLLLNDTFNTRNAMLIARGKDYKIIDLSF